MVRNLPTRACSEWSKLIAHNCVLNKASSLLVTEGVSDRHITGRSSQNNSPCYGTAKSTSGSMYTYFALPKVHVHNCTDQFVGYTTYMVAT